MDMTGEYRIPAPRQRVWEALNDPEILKAAIPGCEELTKVGDNELEARVRAKVGPVSATFTGKVTLSDLNPPESYKISGEGKGGAAGFAKGGAEVKLAEDGADTILRYSAKADVGGKLAQIGSRLIQGTAKKMADDFFGKFSPSSASASPPSSPRRRPDLGDPLAPAQRRDRGAPARRPHRTGADIGDADRAPRQRRAECRRASAPADMGRRPGPPRRLAARLRHQRPRRRSRSLSSPSARPPGDGRQHPVPPAKSGQPWWVWLGGADHRGHRAVLAVRALGAARERRMAGSAMPAALTMAGQGPSFLPSVNGAVKTRRQNSVACPPGVGHVPAPREVEAWFRSA